MSKELEAFKRIRCNYVSVFKARENGKTQLTHDLNTIEQALKEYAKITKALELTKNNDIIATLDYIQLIANNKEEYNLLKEVLL